MGRETCMMQPPTAHGALAHDYSAVAMSAIPRPQQIESTATGDLPTARNMQHSFWFLLFGKFQESFLCLAHIVQRESAGFDEVSHDGPASASEQAEQFV